MFDTFAGDWDDFDVAGDGVFVGEDWDCFWFAFASFDGDGGERGGGGVWVGEFEVCCAGVADAEIAKEFVLQ